MKDILLSPISLEDFETLIKKCVSAELKNYIPPPSEEEQYLTIKETCKLLSISKVTNGNWRREGRLPFYKLGTRIRFKKSEILKALKNGNLLPTR